MKKYNPIIVLLGLILLAFFPSGQGQYATPSSSYSTSNPLSIGTSSPASDYSQYYTMPSGATQSTHIGNPEEISIAGNTPSTVYFGNQMQPVDYAQYQSNPSFTGGSSLWIQGSQSWTQYAAIPEGATVSLLAITPTSGNGYLYFTDSDGKMYTYNYFFYPVSRLTFYADNPGRHRLSFTVNGMASNLVTIDVTGVVVPSSNYLPTPSYYPYYNYNYGYFPGFDYGGDYMQGGDGMRGNGDHKGGDNKGADNKGGDNKEDTTNK